MAQHAILLAVAILTAAAVPRFAAAPFAGVTGDEYQTIATARHDAADLLSARVYDYGNPQGYHLFLSVMRQWLGENLLLYRLTSGAFSTVAVGLTMLLIRAMGFGPPVWLGAGLLMALNAMQLMHALEIRPYAVQFCAVLLSAWAMVRWEQAGRAWLLGAYVLGLCVAFNVQYSTLFIWAAMGLWWLWQNRSNGRGLITVAATNLVVVAALVPTFLLMFWEMRQQALTRGEGTWLYHLVGLPYVFIYGNSAARPERGRLLLLLTSLPVLLVWGPLLLKGLKALWIQSRYRALVLAIPLVPLLVLLALSLKAPLFSSRYVAFAWPMFALLVMLGVCSLRRAWARRTAFTTVALLSGLAFLNQAAYAHTFARTSQAAEALLLQHARGEYGLITYPAMSRQLALVVPDSTAMADLRAGSGGTIGWRLPSPPLDYVKVGPLVHEPTESIARELDRRTIWLLCSTERTSRSADSDRVIQAVPAVMAGAGYRVAARHTWPSPERPLVYLLEFVGTSVSTHSAPTEDQGGTEEPRARVGSVGRLR